MVTPPAPGAPGVPYPPGPMRRRLSAVAAAGLLAGLVLPAAACARTAEQPWPPVDGPGTLFAHIGEEHITDADGATILPKVVEGLVRYRPRLVTASGDKANDGQAAQFRLWQEAMDPLDGAGIPYLAAAGNHDRTGPPGDPGGTAGLFKLTLPGSFDVYRSSFASRPYPWGDAAPYAGIGPARPPGDPAGAAATYHADVDGVRWIFLDNSCWALSDCDAFQARADGGREGQLAFLRARAQEATDAGRLVFVVMHIPTRDPRDQEHADITSRSHTMGKGTSSDNQEFERVAAATGVDGVFVGHIKGQFLYRGQGGVPYFVDGGAGGELYTEGPVGTDHGYWHGFRLVRVHGGRLTTDTVPIFVPGGIRIEGPDVVAAGERAAFAAFGRQPVFHDPAKVEALELRDPAPTPKGARRAEILGVSSRDVAFGVPALMLLLVLGVAAAPAGRRRAAAAGAGLLVAGGSGLALAQQSEPTATPRDALPTPARMWTTSDPAVLAPAASADDDPRRDPATQTEDGRFAAACPGRATISVTSGTEQQDRAVTVASAPGPVIRSVTRARTLRAGRRGGRARAVRVRLAQPAVVTLRLLRARKVVARAPRSCVRDGARDLRLPHGGVRAGRYALEVRVSTDRTPAIARYAVRVR